MELLAPFFFLFVEVSHSLIASHCCPGSVEVGVQQLWIIPSPGSPASLFRAPMFTSSSVYRRELSRSLLHVLGSLVLVVTH